MLFYIVSKQIKQMMILENFECFGKLENDFGIFVSMV